MSSRFISAALLLACFAAPTITGCSLDQAERSVESTGAASLPLTAVGPDGTTYRLQLATFQVTGTQAQTLESGVESALNVNLPVGNYQIALGTGWQLVRIVNGVATPVAATLASPATQSFAISNGATTSILYTFEVGGTTIPLGTGVAQVAISVIDGSAGAGGAPGTGGTSGSSCTSSLDACGVCAGDGSQCVCRAGTLVGTSDPGNTCGLGDSTSLLPRLALNEQEYAAFFTGAGYTPGDALGGSSKGCGACLQVTGPSGSFVGIVSAVADIASVGTYGQPGSVIAEVSAMASIGGAGTGAPTGVAYHAVPCPTAGGMSIHYQSFLSGNPWVATFLTVNNHRYPLASVELRPQGSSTWVPLERDGVNRWHLETYDNRPAMVVPTPASTAPEFRITSLYGDVVVTAPVPWPAALLSSAGQADAATDYQFEARAAATQACTYSP